MLWRSDHFEIFRIVSLQAFDEFNSEPCCQIRIFTIGFLSAAPTRIAKDVDVRAPEGQALITRMLILTNELVMLGARLRRDYIGDLMHQIGVPRRSQTDCLRKDGSVTRAGNAVQRLVPPLVF